MRYSNSVRVRLLTRQKSAANSSSLRPHAPLRSLPGRGSSVTLLTNFSWLMQSRNAQSIAGRWLSARSYKDWSSRHDPSANLDRGRYCTPALLAPMFRILSIPSNPLPCNPERSPSCCNGDLSLIAYRELSTQKEKHLGKILCRTNGY